MKVCFPFVGSTVGGSHISSLVLINHLIREQFEPLIIVGEIGPLSGELERLHYPFLYVPMGRRKVHLSRKLLTIGCSPRALLKMALVLKRYDIDVVHTNDMRMHILWSVVCRLSGVRHLWHQRTAFPLSRLSRWTLRMSSEIVCISNFVRATLPLGQRTRAHVVPNPMEKANIDPIEVQELRAWMCKKAGVNTGAIILGSFGNLRTVKDPITLVQAFIQFSKKTEREVILGIFGEDREGWRHRLKTLLQDQDMGSRCLFVGFKRPVGPWIAACDAVLATSQGDGLGRTIIEAMSLKVPVAAVDAGGHKEALGNEENGILVPPGDPDAMADGLMSIILDQDSRDALVKRAYEAVKQAYSNDRTVIPILDIYDRPASTRVNS